MFTSSHRFYFCVCIMHLVFVSNLQLSSIQSTCGQFCFFYFLCVRTLFRTLFFCCLVTSFWHHTDTPHSSPLCWFGIGQSLFFFCSGSLAVPKITSFRSCPGGGLLPTFGALRSLFATYHSLITHWNCVKLKLFSQFISDIMDGVEAIQHSM